MSASGDLEQEAAGHREARPPPGGALRGVRQIEALARPRQAHVGEAALLLHLARVVERPGVREDALLQAADEDDVELEALGGVQRDERDPVAVAGVGILVGHQRRLLEQAVEGVGRVEVAVALHDLAQLEQVGPAVLAVLRAIHEHGPVARFLERRVEELRQAHQAHQAAQPADERVEGAERVARPRRELPGSADGRPDGGPDVAAVGGRERTQRRDRALAEAARRAR